MQEVGGADDYQECNRWEKLQNSRDAIGERSCRLPKMRQVDGPEEYPRRIQNLTIRCSLFGKRQEKRRIALAVHIHGAAAFVWLKMRRQAETKSWLA